MRSRVALTAAHRSSRLSMTRMKPTPDASTLQERNTHTHTVNPHRKTPLLFLCVQERKRGCVCLSQGLDNKANY